MNETTTIQHPNKKTRKSGTERLLTLLVVLAVLAVGVGMAVIGYRYIQERNAPATTYFDYMLRETRAELRRNPKDPAALTNVGYIYMKMGNERRGISYFDRALKINAKFVPALYNKGMHLKDTGDRDEAVKHLTTAGKNAVKGNKYIAYFSLGEMYFDSEDYDKSLKYLKLANEDNGTIWNVHQKLGEVYELKKDTKKALEHYGIAASFNPTDTDLQEKVKELNDG